MAKDALRDLPPSEEKVGLVTAPPEPHPAGNVRYGKTRQYVRLVLSCSYFAACVLAILFAQIVGCPLYLFNRPLYYTWMAKTKEHFGVLMTTVTQWWSPTVIRVTGDCSVRSQLHKTPDGRLECRFPERLILIANHQLYSDWIYLWWISYTARVHGFLFIILKESLKYLPLLGIGMQFYSFIFLSRKWENDKARFTHRLNKLNPTSKKDASPMWLLIFPEGTNLSDNGRTNSAKYAAKAGLPDMKHQMLPRTTGFRFCLESLKGSVDWVYDCTVAYEGIPRGKFGQDYFTLWSTYMQGRPPKSVNMHWRRFRADSIPSSDPAAFELWLRERWNEKDDLLEYYVQNGRFPEDDAVSDEKTPWTGPIETEVKLSRWVDVLQIFAVPLWVPLFCFWNWCLRVVKRIVILFCRIFVQVSSLIASLAN